MVKTKNQESKHKKEKIVLATGKRKTAVARARIKEGTGRIIINDMPIELWQPEYARLKIREPLLLAEDRIKNLDIKVNVKGGGISSQAEAIRQAIAKGIVEFLKDEKLKNMYLDYDRSLLVFDSRRTEPHKPSRSKKGPRRHKQRSKR
ncbi:MAG: 30S ribosomal protein S9 [Candidatus Aenigmarchaeota archaeon]|nr:30S ribosomal protein S9 [Candidatus Aenigmarchaeota archaeon]